MLGIKPLVITKNVVKKNYDMNTIRGMYGSQKMKSEKEERAEKTYLEG